MLPRPRPGNASIRPRAPRPGSTLFDTVAHRISARAKRIPGNPTHTPFDTFRQPPRPTESTLCETNPPQPGPAPSTLFDTPTPNQINPVRNEIPTHPPTPSTLFDNLRAQQNQHPAKRNQLAQFSRRQTPPPRTTSRKFPRNCRWDASGCWTGKNLKSRDLVSHAPFTQKNQGEGGRKGSTQTEERWEIHRDHLPNLVDVNALVEVSSLLAPP